MRKHKVTAAAEAKIYAQPCWSDNGKMLDSD